MGEKIISKNFVAFLVLVIAGLSLLGNFTVIAYVYEWYDQILHLLGGAWVAVFVLVWLKPRPQFFDVSKNFYATLIFILGAVGLVGIFWEFFEYSLYSQYLFLADTLCDLLLDLVGGLILIGVWRASYKDIK